MHVCLSIWRFLLGLLSLGYEVYNIRISSLTPGRKGGYVHIPCDALHGARHHDLRVEMRPCELGEWASGTAV